jgi:hypothetical protein
LTPRELVVDSLEFHGPAVFEAWEELNRAGSMI